MKHKLISLLCLSACAADASSPQPADFQIDFPMDCTVGQTCWLMNYVDHDTQNGVVKDASCEARSYDGHKGTDIAIRDWGEVLQGVAILAPAPGKVLGIRNGEADQFSTKSELTAIRNRGRECGNGVRIDHGEGWVTQFCHMKKGSVSVAFGDEISAGTKLGEVGMSGITEHPHMHMSLTKDDEVIDPYTGRKASQDCGLDKAQPLWSDAMPYAGFAIYDAGFTAARPNFSAIAQGKREAKPHSTSPAFIFYMSFFGARAKDEIHLTILQPDGETFTEQNITQERTQARRHYFIGRKNSKGRFMTGKWTAKAVILRPDTGERQEITRVIDLSES